MKFLGIQPKHERTKNIFETQLELLINTWWPNCWPLGDHLAHWISNWILEFSRISCGEKSLNLAESLWISLKTHMLNKELSFDEKFIEIFQRNFFKFLMKKLKNHEFHLKHVFCWVNMKYQKEIIFKWIKSVSENWKFVKISTVQS